MLKDYAAQPELLPGWVLRDHQLGLKDPASVRLARASVNAGHILAPSFDPPGQARHVVERFLRLVRCDIGRVFTIAGLAQDLQLSITQLERACHDQRGRSPLELINDLRLEYAITQLRAGHRAADIARQVGYVGLPHMKRAFIAATGRRPEDFSESPAQPS